MNNRSKLAAVLVVLLLAGWWLWARRQVKLAEAQGKAATASSAIPTTSQPGSSNTKPASLSAPTPTPVDPKAAKIAEYIAAENARNLDFYGKVIDQHGDPVAGVKVKAGVGIIVNYAESGGEKYYTETDAAGRFSFLGIHGSGVGFILTKEGYSFEQRQPASSRPTNYVPDPDNPTVFRMWKLQGAEPIVHTSIQAGLACDGTSRKFDPLTGRRDAGDLVATLTRNPVNIDRGKPFDWTLTLGIAGGGLIPINDLYPDEAPADGYQSSVAINMPSDTKNWTPSVVQSYYIFDGKNYGRITINIMANYQPPPTHFEIDSYVNPSGSRNLEFDPSKQVR